MADRRLSSQRHSSGRVVASTAGEGVKSSPRLRIANLMAFQSLLHQCRYATTFLISKLMSRPCTQLPNHQKVGGGGRVCILEHAKPYHFVVPFLGFTHRLQSGTWVYSRGHGFTVGNIMVLQIIWVCAAVSVQTPVIYLQYCKLTPERKYVSQGRDSHILHCDEL